MLLKSCNRCGTLIQYGSVYCDICAPIIEGEREARRRELSLESNRRYNKTRDPKYGRFYSSTNWRVLSKSKIQGVGYRCEKCGGIASEVDHIIPIQTPEGWDRRLDYDNLQALCITCHNAKHERFKSKRSKRPKGF